MSFVRKVEESEAVRTSCWTLGLGGWVGGRDVYLCMQAAAGLYQRPVFGQKAVVEEREVVGFCVFVGFFSHRFTEYSAFRKEVEFGEAPVFV